MQSAGDRIRYIRKQLGLSQTSFGNAIGQNRLAVSRWESGDQEPRPVQLMVLADLLALSPKWLLSGQGEPPEITPETIAALEESKKKAAAGLAVPSVRLRGGSGHEHAPWARALTPDMQAMFELWLNGISQRISGLMEERPEWPTVPGLSHEVMEAFFKQRAIPSMRMVVAFAEAFTVDEGWLLTGISAKHAIQRVKTKSVKSGTEPPPHE